MFSATHITSSFSPSFSLFRSHFFSFTLFLPHHTYILSLSLFYSHTHTHTHTQTNEQTNKWKRIINRTNKQNFMPYTHVHSIITSYDLHSTSTYHHNTPSPPHHITTTPHTPWRRHARPPRGGCGHRGGTAWTARRSDK